MFNIKEYLISYWNLIYSQNNVFRSFGWPPSNWLKFLRGLPCHYEDYGTYLIDCLGTSANRKEAYAIMLELFEFAEFFWSSFLNSYFFVLILILPVFWIINNLLFNPSLVQFFTTFTVLFGLHMQMNSFIVKVWLWKIQTFMPTFMIFFKSIV